MGGGADFRVNVCYLTQGILCFFGVCVCRMFQMVIVCRNFGLEAWRQRNVESVTKRRCSLVTKRGEQVRGVASAERRILYEEKVFSRLNGPKSQGGPLATCPSCSLSKEKTRVPICRYKKKRGGVRSKRGKIDGRRGRRPVKMRETKEPEKMEREKGTLRNK